MNRQCVYRPPVAMNVTCFLAFCGNLNTVDLGVVLLTSL